MPYTHYGGQTASHSRIDTLNDINDLGDGGTVI